jgi:hypothetical protein
MARKSGFGPFTTQPHDGPDIVLQYLKALGRSHGEHPSDQGEIDTVLAMGRQILLASFLFASPLVQFNASPVYLTSS